MTGEVAVFVPVASTQTAHLIVSKRDRNKTAMATPAFLENRACVFNFAFFLPFPASLPPPPHGRVGIYGQK